MPTMTSAIRLTSKTDIAAIQHIADITWHDTFYPDLLKLEHVWLELTREYSEQAIQAQQQEGQTFVVLEDPQGQVVAFLSFSVLLPEACLKINKLYCLPAQQGHGYGKQLLEWAETEALKRNLKGLKLWVNRGNKAVSFYKTQGFSIEKEEDTPYGDVIREDYIMLKPLQAP